jgi:hypothetical protein
LPLILTSTLSSVAECHHLVVVRMLIADRSAWCFLAIVSAVQDYVKGRRLRHRHLGVNLSAVACGGLFQHGCIHLVGYNVRR